MLAFVCTCLAVLLLASPIAAKPSPSSQASQEIEVLFDVLRAFDSKLSSRTVESNFLQCVISVACYTCGTQLLPCLQRQDAKDCLNFGRCVVGHAMTDCKI